MVAIHSHARDRMELRGASETEIVRKAESGETFPAKHGLTGFRRNFSGDWTRNGQRFDTKQLEVYAVHENGQWLAVTVIVKYF